MEGLEIERKTILVTGGAGFIGSHVVKQLVHRKANIIVIDIAIDSQSFFAKEQLKKQVIYKHIDIRNKNSVNRVFKEYTPDYIFHLAAEPIVSASYENPHATFMTNVMGTVNVLEASRNNEKTKAVIVASSDKAYGKTKEAYTESSPLQGDHPYDVSKSCTDLIAQTYYKTYGLPVIVTRFGNVYGEGDIHFDRIIPGICEALLQGEVLKIRSDGTYIRDYVYAKDVASAYLFLLIKQKDAIGEAFNVSSNSTFSVLDLVHKIEEILKRKIPYKIFNTAKNEIPYQHLIDEKIRKLGWKQQISFNEGIQNTFSWYARKTFLKQ